MRVFRSAREAMGSLFEQSLPGNLVKLRSQDAGSGVFGRVLSSDDPQLEGKLPVPGHVFVVLPSGVMEEFNLEDLEKIRPDQVPGDELLGLYGEGDEQTLEVLHDVDGDLVAEVLDLGRPDPERSMAARLAQRMPLTRNKKSRAMKRNWRRAKSRSGDRKLGHEPLGAFESLVEQELGTAAVGLDGPNKTDDIHFGQDTKKVRGGPVDPHTAHIQTRRVFEVANDLMRALTAAKGGGFFHSIADDPDRGYVRIKLNGTAPKSIVEKFVRDVGDVDLSVLEKPEGSEGDDDLTGWWVFEARIPDFEEHEEGEYPARERPETVSRGELPGEILIPETGGEGTEL